MSVKAPKHLALQLRAERRGLTLTSPGWRGLRIGPAKVRLTIGGKTSSPRLRAIHRGQGGSFELIWQSVQGLALRQRIEPDGPRRWRFLTQLANEGRRPATFDGVDLLTLAGSRGGRFDLGKKLAQVRVLEQCAYNGQVRSVGQILTGSDQRLSMERTAGSFVSRLVTLLHSPADGCALLLGFESFDRWHGVIRGGSSTARGELPTAFDNLDASTGAPPSIRLANSALKLGQRLTEFAVENSSEGVPIEPGESAVLERFVIEIGDDPYTLLDDYADRVAANYRVQELGALVRGSLVNWCSWYPYRLGVTQERMLETARAAKARHLDKLGLRFIQADLGWEKHNLPAYFEENQRFDRGLAWLAGRLKEEGFELGVWKGFTCVDEGHPIARRHPDWLLRDAAGKLLDNGKWFWEPHARIYSLDPSHPEALAWVRQQIAGLAKKGVGYLKWDFGGNVTGRGVGHDRRVVRSNGAEGIRRLARVVREGMGPRGVVLDCTGSEVGGVGQFQLLYTNYDTGNTGIGYAHLRGTNETLASHLFKNHRWGLLQPSCLVVGLPGTLEEARVRATATFLSAGHVDLADNLTNLPEERWKVLLSVLPPNRTTARVVDLYHPVRLSAGDYVALCRGEASQAPWTDEPQGGNVWHCRQQADWDQWDLVGIFNIASMPDKHFDAGTPRRFEIPFSLLGLDPARSYWAHEFWSGQFLGRVPRPLWPAGAYRHPGDDQGLIRDSSPGMLDVAFTPPAVKLLVIRRPRSHPWPVGTSFHQSGGLELAGVQWDARRRTLSGVLRRPPGQEGTLVIAGVDPAARLTAFVDGKRVVPGRGANGAVTIPIVTRRAETPWRLKV